MVVAINTRLLLAGKLEGVGIYTHNILRILTQKHTDTQFVFLFDRAYDPSFIYGDNIKPVVLFPQARHPILYKLFLDWAIPQALKKYKADLFYSPDNMNSQQTKVKSLLTIHDLAFYHYPEQMRKRDYNYFYKAFPKYIKAATRLTAVSEYTKQDICKVYQVSPDRIDIIPNSCSEVFHPLSMQEQADIRKKITGGSPYFMFVGSIHPRKNIKHLILAFDQFKQKTGKPHKLVLIGRFAWQTEDVKFTLENSPYKADILQLDYRPSEELAKTVASAEAQMYVSYFEGFGIPILEGISSGTPVICSDTTSMPEVAGDAALLIQPDSVESISNAMIKLTGDPILREELIRRGLVQKQKFSWEKSADLLWESFEKTLS